MAKIKTAKQFRDGIDAAERERTMTELGIPKSTYWWGVVKFFLELPRLMKSGVCGVSSNEWLSLRRVKP